MTGFLSVVLFAAIYALDKNVRLVAAATVLMVLTLVLMWLAKPGVTSPSSVSW